MDDANMEKVTRLPDSSLPGQRAIEAGACAWIAQLDGKDPSGEDLAAFHEWVNRSPKHKEEIRRLSELWDDLNILTELAVPVREKRKKPAVLPIWASAFAVLILLFGTWGYIRFGLPEPPHVYSTAVGEQKTVALPDGSSIQLNTASRVRVDYSDAERKVRLLQGEAFFKVASDRQRPFVVYVRERLVRAVGTAFTVYVQRESIEVAVTEGVVEFAKVATLDVSAESNRAVPEAKSTVTTVTAGQKATLDRGAESVESVKREELNRMLSWREGLLVFSGEPLEQVVEEISRYTSLRIMIVDPRIRGIRVGGYFRTSEINTIFDALEASFGVQVDHLNERVIQLSAAAP